MREQRLVCQAAAEEVDKKPLTIQIMPLFLAQYPTLGIQEQQGGILALSQVL